MALPKLEDLDARLAPLPSIEDLDARAEAVKSEPEGSFAVDVFAPITNPDIERQGMYLYGDAWPQKRRDPKVIKFLLQQREAFAKRLQRGGTPKSLPPRAKIQAPESMQALEATAAGMTGLPSLESLIDVDPGIGEAGEFLGTVASFIPLPLGGGSALRAVRGVRKAKEIQAAAREMAALEKRVLPSLDDLDAVAIQAGPDLTGPMVAARTAEAERGSLSLRAQRRQRFHYLDASVDADMASARGIPVESTLDKIKRGTQEFVESWRTDIKNLPKGAKWEPARFSLRNLNKSKSLSSAEAIGDLEKIAGDLSEYELDLLRNKVIVDDIAEDATRHEIRRLERAAAGDPSVDKFVYPGAWTADKLTVESARLDSMLTPKVVQALERRKAIWDQLKSEYTSALSDIGLDVKDKLTRENYFRHQVLEYADAKKNAAGGLRTPSGRSHLKARTGTGARYNTEYAEAEYEVMAQMRHDIRIAKTLKTVQNKYDISNKLKAEAKRLTKAGTPTKWQDLLPDTHSLWQPREGNIFYRATTIPEKIFNEALESGLQTLEVDVKDLRKSLAIGGNRKEWAIPNELAATLDEINAIKDAPGAMRKGLKTLQSAWKINALFNPRRFPTYSLRNLAGDADKTFAGNPAAFRKVKQSIQDLYSYYRTGVMPPNLQAAMDRGLIQSSLFVQELGELKDLDRLRKYFDTKYGLRDIPAKAWRGYWKGVKVADTNREAVLRYANFLEYKDQMLRSGGRPRNFGASVPEEVMALDNIDDRAYKLSNELIGAYDGISLSGQTLREYIYPFWSWKEANFKSYAGLIRNAARDGNTAKMGARILAGTVAARSPIIAARVGAFALKASAFWAMTQAWNLSMFPDIEKELAAEVRGKPHLIFGRNANGDPVYFTRLGALGDFLEWFGLDAPANMVTDFLDGRRSIKEIAVDMAKDPVNVVAQGTTPLIKIPAEMAMRRSIYPDAFKPSMIRDRGVYLARSLGLENEYREIAGLPTRGYAESLKTLYAYRSDPKEIAYFEFLNDKFRFLHKRGKDSSSISLSPKAISLYYYKEALRFEDKRAAKKYLNQYIAEGGTAEGMADSLKAMHPLYFGSKADAAAFMGALTPRQKEQLQMATEYWKELVGKRRIQAIKEAQGASE